MSLDYEQYMRLDYEQYMSLDYEQSTSTVASTQLLYHTTPRP